MTATPPPPLGSRVRFGSSVKWWRVIAHNPDGSIVIARSSLRIVWPSQVRAY